MFSIYIIVDEALTHKSVFIGSGIQNMHM